MLKKNATSPISFSSATGFPISPVHGSAGTDCHLRVLSYNIQVGFRTSHYGHYVTRAWRHALPGPGMHRTLDNIANVMRDYDFVAIQEADAGSLRTQFTNQVEYLAQRAGFAYWGLSVTRDLHPVARHALAFVSRFAPAYVEEHVLPSTVPGRRALSVRLGADAGGLHLLVAHLSLVRGARSLQLDYLNRLVPEHGPVVLLGDLNCSEHALRGHATTTSGRLCVPEITPLTFPSWRPRMSLDHILHSSDVQIKKLHALSHAISDHLPLAAEVVFKRQ